MRKSNSQFITKFISEAGLDKQNSTYYGFVELDKYYCVAVAEGYDDEGGSESARIAVETAVNTFAGNPGMSSGKLRECLQNAHRILVEQSVRIKLKAGLLLLVSDYTRCRYAVCGNVVMYLLRGNNIIHQSVTHTVYQSMLEERENPSSARTGETGPAPETKNLYHYLGGSAGIRVSGKIKLKDDDQILLATESFWNRVSRIEVVDAFESFQSEQDFLGDLQELYLRGSTDYIGSYSLAGVNVAKAYKENTKLKKKILLWSIILLLVLAVGLSVFYVINRRQRINQEKVRNTLTSYEEAGDGYLTGLDYELAGQQYEKAVTISADIKNNEEQLSREKELSGKISVSSNLEQAETAYETMEFEKARELYRQVLSQIKIYPELEGLEEVINRKLDMVQYGMEIDTYLESGALKEAEGDMEAAGMLYGRAQSMLRIVNYPELLKQAQLSLLRVSEQAAQEGEEASAKKRDQVILEADEQAALEAALAEDYETAITLYTQIRDGYVALEYNDKAKEISMLLTLLQKQLQTAQKAELSKELYADRMFLLQEEALEAVMARDMEKAIDKYDQMIQICIAGGNTDGAALAQAAVEYLKNQLGGGAADGQ